MGEKNHYSNEHINAYIDGELDNEERACLIFDEQQDSTLARRINDVRILKEKIRLAYSDIPETDTINKSLNSTSFISKQKSLIVGLLILLTASALLLPTIINNDDILLAKQLIKKTLPIAPDTLSKIVGTNKQVIINISQYQVQQFDSTLDNIEALLQQHLTDPLFNVEIVANNSGLKALNIKTSPYAERITLLEKRFSNVNVIACAKTMAELAAEGDAVQLMKSIMITPSAAEQVAKRMSEGWIYLKL